MITIDRLTKRFDRRAVLDELTLSIDAGDRIALIGSNGAGKTTLFRCLLGHYGHQGTISFDGSAGRRREASALARVAFVPQLPPPLRMPVGELLAFAERGAGADAALMREIAGRMGIDLDEVKSRPFYRLSGGQKQKILVTVALGRAVDLMIFDEPAANLDPAARAVFIDLLAERKEASMLIASHRLEEVAPLVNRVIELDRGRVVLDDEVVDRLRAGEFRMATITLAQPHEPFAAALAGWGFATDPAGLRFTGPVPAAETFRFLGLLARYGSLIDSLALDQDVMERV
ncbi:ATP-binding cassette domain-containing protein [Pseudothioclava nitratireducens]|jgi:ABC-2 type transport system ATP-binding protein|uniref:ATP-binding cassette domain-containing protein n=1 Tax=Pseudothioclava nitratireducens TaxID=1928646 RepID=UPI0023DC6A7A|nr:ABC transporter ATP-binding protein [Defluviimonas nitratireducens]MDF1618931.1 ABC transporter ATP-binding protein [Defluviimonas nitratireducens]